jgi:5-methyltetrahydrofolate--homocysteine methyltransferase
LLYKEDWSERKEDFKSWWDRDLNKPLIQVFAPKVGSKDVAWDIWSFVKNWGKPHIVIEEFENYCRNTFFGGGAYPNLWINLGPCSVAAYMGAKPRFSAETIWYEKLSWEEIESLNLNSTNEWWRYTKEATAEACKIGKGKFIVGFPDIGAVTDIVCLLRGSKNLIMDLYRNLNKVKKLCDQIFEVWFKIYEELHESMKAYGQNGTSSWLDLWCHKRYYPIHADFAYMLPPSKFKEFVLPYLKDYCLKLDYAIYHLDGIGQIPHVDMLLEIDELTGIQWVPGAGQPPVDDPKWLPLYKKIQRAGKNLVLRHISPDRVKFILENLDLKGLAFSTQTKSEKDLMWLLNRF